jgi:hypothetical protein
MSCHDPSACCTRTGANVDSVVHDPSGFANDCEDSVRADRSSTREPCATAACIAVIGFARTVTGTGVVLGATAWAGGATGGSAVNSEDAMAAAATPATTRTIRKCPGRITRNP